MKKPTQVTMVNALPFTSAGAAIATEVENNGESATTEKPQINRKISMMELLPLLKMNGDNRQQQKEINKNKNAVRCTP